MLKQEDIVNRKDTPFVVSWGGGVNSTSLLIGLKQREIVPDLIMFADTGGEKPETYDYIKIFNSWLEQNKFPTLTIVKNDGMYSSLEDNCLKKKMLPSRAYGFDSCADKYKIRPQDKFVKHWEPGAKCLKLGNKIIKALGYDGGELRRASILENDKYLFWYPLIEWDWDRDKCIQVIQSAGLPVPVKSACFFCPSSRKNEVLWLAKTHPELFKRCVEMERNAAENLMSVKGLGRKWSWEELVNKPKEEQMTFWECPVEGCIICNDDSEAD